MVGTFIRNGNVGFVRTVSVRIRIRVHRVADLLPFIELAGDFDRLVIHDNTLNLAGGMHGEIDRRCHVVAMGCHRLYQGIVAGCKRVDALVFFSGHPCCEDGPFMIEQRHVSAGNLILIRDVTL